MTKPLIYLLTFAVGFVLVSLWSFWIVIRPPKIILGQTPQDYGILDYERIELKTQDGLALAAWFIPKQEVRSDTSSLILLHGYPAEKSDMLPIAKSLVSRFSLLLLDMRYFGESEGKFSTLGKREVGDLKAALDFLEERGYRRVGVFGFSLGGAVGIMAAEKDRRIKAAAAYAPFANLKLVGREAYKKLLILKYPLVELLAFWARIFFEYDVNSLSPEKAARNLRIPVLLIHSRDDEQISFRHSEILQGKLLSNPAAEFYFLDGYLHGELPVDFERRLAEFFEKNL